MNAEKQSEIPLRMRARRWLVVAVSCTVAGVLFASLSYVINDLFGKPKAQPYVLFEWWLSRFYLYAAMSPIVMWLVRRLSLLSRPSRNVFLHFAASLLFSLVHLAIHATLFLLLSGHSGRAALFGSHASFIEQVLNMYPFGVIAYWVIIAIAYARHYYERYGLEQLRASHLQSQLAEARLRALQMQLQPHFLFNALHSLSDLVNEEPKTAVRLIARLGDFLRLTLHNSGSHAVPLNRELDFLNAYLEIERIRFADRLRVIFDIHPEALDAEVPNLILQPIVENAIRYGVSAQIGPGLVEILARKHDHMLEIEIRDNGPGFPDPIPDGLGLTNTHARLKEVYGVGYSLTLRNRKERGAVVSLQVPYRPFQEEHDKFDE